jgi:predicted DNA-binding transcriptional regulator AlpA
MTNLPGNLPNESSSDSQQNPAFHPVLDGFLRREELAQQLGLSPRTIDRWQALRLGPPRVCVGRTVLYRVEAVRRWLQTCEQQLETSPSRKRR